MSDESQNLAQQYLDIAGVILVAIDADGDITLLNRKGHEVLEYPEESLIGKNWFETCLPERNRVEVASIFRQLMAGNVQAAEHAENPVLTRSGRERLIAWHNTLLKDATGKCVGTLSSGEDITERRRAEEELRETRRQAIAANRAKSEFLANMSHEIRTPMTTILGFADLLTSPNLSHEERRDFLETITRNVRFLLALITDILDLSKIEAEKMSIEFVDCSLRQLVDDVLGVVRVRAQVKGLSLEVAYDSSLPETIRTDPTRLRQILVNLAGNAIKFTDRGGVHISIWSGEPRQGSAQVRFAISDTGVGIDPAKLGELFQPFTQADASTTRRFGGTGLGLAISKRLANLLGGDIEVASELGRGSTFTVTVAVGKARSSH